MKESIYNAGTRRDYIEYRITKSKEAFEDDKLLANNRRWNSSVNRLYYSSYYLVSALLYSKDVRAHTHNGIKTQFNFNFIKSNILEIRFGKLYSNLFDWRQESDYADFIDFDEETIIPLIEQVFQLNEKILGLIN